MWLRDSLMLMGKGLAPLHSPLLREGTRTDECGFFSRLGRLRP